MANFGYLVSNQCILNLTKKMPCLHFKQLDTLIVLELFGSAHDSMYLGFLVDLRVHLRAEEGKEAHYVPSSEVALLTVGHAQVLILHHFSPDHHGGGEP